MAELVGMSSVKHRLLVGAVGRPVVADNLYIILRPASLNQTKDKSILDHRTFSRRAAFFGVESDPLESGRFLEPDAISLVLAAMPS